LYLSTLRSNRKVKLKNESTNTNYLSTFGSAVLFHFVVATILYLCLYYVGEIKVLPNSQNITAWDAINYINYQNKGYLLEGFSNLRFFPFAPLVWYALSLSSVGAAICNIVLFLTGLFLLTKHYHFSFQTLVLYLSIPSIFFLVIPYSEPMFLFTTTLVLIGLDKKNNGLVMAGLFMASMTRPSMLFFFPAILFVELMYLQGWNFSDLKKPLFRVFLFFAASLLGLGIVLAIQYQYTEDWLAFFHYRDANGFQFPAFPVTTWGGGKLMWLDGFAFAITVATFFYSLFIFFRKISDFQNISFPPKSILFALAYITMTMVHILFFNDKDAGTGTSTLFGLNRFVFATSFFVLLFGYFIDKIKLDKNSRKWFWIAFVLFLGLIGVFKPSNFPDYLRPAIYLLFMASFLFLRKKYSKYWILIYITNAIIQVLYFDKFLRDIWVG